MSGMSQEAESGRAPDLATIRQGRHTAAQPLAMHRRRRIGRRVGITVVVALFTLTVSASSALAEPLDSWSPAASMQVARESHTATLLPDGRVLVAGGQRFAGSPPFASAELYDPVKDTWSSAGDMSVRRFGHTASLLRSGKVLVVGGVEREDAATAELYDPETNTWSHTASMDQARRYHTATLLPNGKVLVFGGDHSPWYAPPNPELYDPGTNTWSLAARPIIRRNGATATLLPNGKVLVAGGALHGGSEDNNAARAELYDPDSNGWSRASDTIFRHLHRSTGTLLPSGKVLLVGGGFDITGATWVERYDPDTNAWSSGPHVSGAPASNHTATLLRDGRVLIAAGGAAAAPDTAVALYDPLGNSWSPGPPISVRRVSGATATLLNDGRVLLAGGTSGGFDPFASAELFTPIRCEPRPGAGCETTLTLALDGPRALNKEGETYSPNPFEISGTVANTGARAAETTKVTLSLPPGLTLASGSATHAIGVLEPGERKTLAWQVRASPRTDETTVRYFATAMSANAAPQSTLHEVVVPGIFAIEAVTPNRGGNAGQVTVDIRGAGFQQDAAVRVADLGAQHTEVVSPERIRTTLDLRDEAAGSLDVEVVNPDEATAKAPMPFIVVSGGEGVIALDLLGPAVLRAGRQAPYYAVTANAGLVDLQRVLLTLEEGEAARQRALSASGLSSSLHVGGPAVPPGGLVIDRLPAGLSSFFHRTFGWPTPGCRDLLAEAESDECRRLREELAALQRLYLRLKAEQDAAENEYRAKCSNPIDEINNRERCRQLVALIAELRARIAGVEQEIARKKEEIARKCGGSGRVMSLHARDGRSSSQAVPSTAPSAGGQHARASLTVCVVAALDPNDKYGSAGSGVARYVRGGRSLPYNVVFENKPDATAPAQEVVVTDRLDAEKLDLDTFSLGPINFADKRVEPPPGLTQFSTDVDLRPGNDLIVRINAGLDKATGEVTWRFLSLDPDTGLPTTEPFAGFLLPNKTSPEGEGGVLYTVSPKKNLPSGTEIRNRASIVFDTNDPIDTPEWLNTIDESKPMSEVLPLAARQRSPSFEVRWKGEDPDAGVEDYAIFVSEDGAPYTIWQSSTTATSTTFNGEPGKTYSFYSVAHDKVGNLEDPPASPDATTHVNAPPDCSGVAAEPVKLWPPNHRFRRVQVNGATDPDGDRVELEITGVRQDEPVDGLGDGDVAPDARAGDGPDEVFLRAERSGDGDGRSYRVAFKASDDEGGQCSGKVFVGVPHDEDAVPLDSGKSYDSFGR